VVKLKYVYPAVLTEIKGEGYGVEFPDLKGCVDEGDDLISATQLAQDGLNDWLMFLEDTGKTIPVASDIRSLKLEENQIATLVLADTESWRKNEGRG